MTEQEFEEWRAEADKRYDAARAGMSGLLCGVSEENDADYYKALDYISSYGLLYEVLTMAWTQKPTTYLEAVNALDYAMSEWDI